MIEDRGVTWYVEKRIVDRLPPEGAELEVQAGDRGAWRIAIEPLPGAGGLEPVTRWFPPADPYIQAYRHRGGEME